MTIDLNILGWLSGISLIDDHSSYSSDVEMQFYVWDESAYVPVMVKNKPAEILVGNIKAESVHSTYQKQKQGCGQRANKSMEEQCGQGLDFYSLWLILLRSLLQHGKNSPLKFKVNVDMTKKWEKWELWDAIFLTSFVCPQFSLTLHIFLFTFKIIIY